MDKILSDDAQAVSEREVLLPSEDRAREAFWGCYPENGNGDMSDVWMMAYRWCRAALKQQPAAQPIPAAWREAVKVAREALLSVPKQSQADDHIDAALAQLDALTKEQT